MPKSPNFKTLLLVVCVILSFFLLLWGATYLMKVISPFSDVTNFIISLAIIIGFFVGGGFAFKKLKII